MPRKKEYNREEVLMKAIAVFWEKGFEGASMQDLVSATGLNRFGMYEAFENKEGLFKACLEAFLNNMNCMLFGDLRDNPRGLPSIQAFYERLTEVVASGKDMKGCLILNTAIDCPCRDKAIVNMIQNQYKKSEELFRTNLDIAKNQGDIAPDSDTTALAQYLVGINHALMVMHRISTPIEEMKKFIQTAFKTINSSVNA